MAGETDAAATFAAADIGWIDFESRSDTDIRAGTVRYATEADAIVIAYAIGDGPVQTVAVSGFGAPLTWANMWPDLRKHHEKVIRGEAVWAAWNASFDRAIWNYATTGFPEMAPHHIIDVMAQATASGLPPDLAMAAKMSGSATKVESGSKLVALFCTPKGLKGVRGTPQKYPNDWLQFVEYAKGDVEAMRSVFKGTRQLPLAEWQEYWAMEAINERGVGIDLEMATAAARLAAEDRVRSRAELAELTGNEVRSVDEVAKITGWLLPRLDSEGRDILIKRREEIDEETGEIIKPVKYSLTRKKVERLIVLCANRIDHENIQVEYADQFRRIMRVLQIRLYGGSKTPAKFARMLEQQVDGVLYNQYTFNGAAGTGRASSKGVQVHNLARDTLEDEHKLIEALLDNCDYDALAAIGPDPVARKLSLLIRPCFVPSGDRVFVWSDWSQIEARIVPWLADHYPRARQRLELFRAVDEDPTLPDLYTRTAAELSHVPVDQVTKVMRQRGKVAELALGFCGGVNALQAMAASYGMHIADDEGQVIVDRWRQANSWAIDYSREIWEAMRLALKHPGIAFQAGRIWMRFYPHYLGGSLQCRLPSGRRLTYRDMRWQDIDVLDEDDKPTGEKKLELMFSRGYGRAKIWPGLFVENFTQATAADVLRGTLVRLERCAMPIRLHTHDEILAEVELSQAAQTSEWLRGVMQRGFDWSGGLPLMSEETSAYFYTKNEKGHGL